MTRLLAVSALSGVTGGESTLLRTLPALARLGYRVRLAVPAPGPLKEAAAERGIPTAVVPLGPPEAFTAWALAGASVALVQLLRSDVVWLNGPSTQRLVPALALTRRRAILRFNNPIAEPPAWWRRKGYWRIVRAVSVPSRATAQECIAAGAPEELVHVMMPPAWSNERPPMSPKNNGRSVDVGFVGTLEPRKGLQDLLQAANSFLERHPDTTLTVIGAAPRGDDGRYAAQLRETAASSPFHDRIIFRGYVPNAASELAAFDLLVIPSRAEPMASVTGEAAAAGVPVVVTSVGGLPEGAAEGGVVVPPGDPQALSEAISALVSDPVRRRQLSERALAGANRFDPVRFAQAMDALLGTAMGRTL